MYFYKTALYLAVEKGNIEILNLLLSKDGIDINALNVFVYFIIRFKIIYFNEVIIYILTARLIIYLNNI